jgi:putative oxidoreductase
MGVPMAGVLAPLVALIEFIGGAAVLLGVYARYAALLLAGVMFGAMTMVHLKNGFFLPQGYEYTLVLLAANLAIFVAGPGAAALVRRS